MTMTTGLLKLPIVLYIVNTIGNFSNPVLKSIPFVCLLKIYESLKNDIAIICSFDNSQERFLY